MKTHPAFSIAPLAQNKKNGIEAIAYALYLDLGTIQRVRHLKIDGDFLQFCLKEVGRLVSKHNPEFSKHETLQMPLLENSSKMSLSAP